MSKFLLGRLGEDRTLSSEMSGTTVSGAKLAALLEKMEEYRTHVGKLSQRGIPEGLVRALLDRGMTGKAEFSENNKVEGPAKAARAFGVEKAEGVADEEHSGWALEITRKVNGVPRSATIDAEFVGAFEFKRIKETAKAIGGFLDGPYVVTRNGETAKHETLSAVVDALYDSAHNRLVINRSNALAHMN